MNKRLLALSVAGLVLAVPAAVAQEGLKLTAGSVTFGGLYSNVNSKNPAKFYEYRDMYSGVIGDIDIRTRSDKWYFDAFIENVGRTDQFFDLKGGKYNLFKYEVYGDWLQHNFSMRPAGATSPYSGIGTSTLTATFPNLNPASWNDSFNYATNRQNIGGMIEFSNIYVSPWYVRFDGNEVRTTGVAANIASNALGSSPGNGFTDLPSPVDYVTRNWTVEGGYSTKQAQFAVNFLKSDFTNDNQTLKWTNAFFNNQLDSSTLAPDNSLWKVSANGAVRQLPWNSTLAGRVTYSELTSDTNLFGSMLTTGGVYVPTLPSNANYNGKIKNTTVALSFASNPTRAVDSRVYYNYYDKKNDSNQITIGNCTLLTAAPFTSCQNELFSYTRNNAGIDVGYRFSAANRLSGIIDYNYMDQERVDYPNTTQWTYGLEWRNNSLDWLGARLGLSYITRRSDFGNGSAGVNATDFTFLERYVARYDLSNLNQTRLKLVLDSSPIALLDLGFEGYWKWNDYKDNSYGFSPVIGRKYDQRQEYYASASWGDPGMFRVTFFGDIEFIQYDSYHRNIGTSPCAANSNCGNPNTPPTATNYNWTAINRDTNWALGLGTDWKAMDRLTIKGSAIWSRTEGSADIASQNNFGAPFPIRSYDTTSKVTLNLKGVYQYSRNWEFTGGYAYENYRYADDQFNGYQYTVPGATLAQTSYLSGAYAYPGYSANILYAMAKYKF